MGEDWTSCSFCVKVPSLHSKVSQFSYQTSLEFNRCIVETQLTQIIHSSTHWGK